MQNTGVQEAIESLDEATKVIPEESVESADTRNVVIGDIKPLLPEELDKIANCLVELKSALEAAPGAIVKCQSAVLLWLPMILLGSTSSEIIPNNISTVPCTEIRLLSVHCSNNVCTVSNIEL